MYKLPKEVSDIVKAKLRYQPERINQRDTILNKLKSSYPTATGKRGLTRPTEDLAAELEVIQSEINAIEGAYLAIDEPYRKSVRDYYESGIPINIPAHGNTIYRQKAKVVRQAAKNLVLVIDCV